MALRGKEAVWLMHIELCRDLEPLHVLVRDGRGRDVIPKTIQLVAGRTGQEYNQRKNRKGTFGEDRCHATAVEADFHLIRCMVNIDLNMVRAGVIVHPSEWLFSGYNDIQIPRKRYSLIDYEVLMELLNIKNMDELKQSYRGWVEEELVNEDQGRQPRWTESVAVGSESFVENTKEKLGTRAMGRQIIGRNGSYDLREFSEIV